MVTARNTDIGAFIPAGSGTQLFRMAAISRLRVYVTVPQALSSLIRAGEQAELTVDQFPGRKFPAHVVGTAGAISSHAKRLLTELEVPNPTGELSSGSYVQITLVSRLTIGASSYQQKPYCSRLHNRRSPSSMPMVRWQFKASPSSMIWARDYKFPEIYLNRISSSETLHLTWLREPWLLW